MDRKSDDNEFFNTVFELGDFGDLGDMDDWENSKESDDAPKQKLLIGDEGGDCKNGNKSNESTDGSGKRKRTLPGQIKKIVTFMQTHTDFNKGTAKANEVLERAWENLASELNAMGPPVHSSKQWRSVWSQFKAN